MFPNRSTCCTAAVQQRAVELVVEADAAHEVGRVERRAERRRAASRPPAGPAAGENTSRAWNVRDTGCSITSGFVISCASTMPPQASAAGIRRPLSGPTNRRPSPVRSAIARRPGPDAGVDDREVHADRQVRDRPGEDARAVPDRLRADAVGDVDDLRVRADAQDDAVADADEVVRGAEVGQERDDGGAHRFDRPEGENPGRVAAHLLDPVE